MNHEGWPKKSGAPASLVRRWALLTAMFGAFGLWWPAAAVAAMPRPTMARRCPACCSDIARTTATAIRGASTRSAGTCTTSVCANAAATATHRHRARHPTTAAPPQAPPAPPPPPPAPPPPGPVAFPLHVEAGKRHLVNARGQPFFIHGDTPWSIEVQLTRPQILAYLDDRQAKGFTALMFQAIEHEFSSQAPPWKNAEGHQPFSSDGNFGARVEAYWQLLDFVIAEANRRSIVCIVHPAYLGFGGGNEGWSEEVQAAPRPTCTRMAPSSRRYRGRGVIWCMGGDYNGQPSRPAREAMEHRHGLRAIDRRRSSRPQSARDRLQRLGRSAGFNLNNIYTDGTEYEHAAVEYARPGPLPFFLIEGHYDGEGATEADCRRQAYATVLSGGCGHLFGNSPLWGFGDPQAKAAGARPMRWRAASARRRRCRCAM